LFIPAIGSAREVFDPPEVPSVFFASPSREKIVIDGELTEPSWANAAVITAFLQKEPLQQAPASHSTEVRVLFDDDALYIAAICYQPKSMVRVQNLQRDFSFDENDLFGIAIDGFLDKRNSVVFQTTPFGNQRDLEVIDGSEANTNWDARWSVRTRIDADAWTAEIAIPWRSLRYPAGADRFGVIFSRNIRSLNEQITAPAVPRAYSIHQMAYEGELRGIVPPPPKTNIQLTPYVLAKQQSTSSTDGGASFDVGGEVKWAITSSTVIDLTFNTDFAQADADRQVINLERFSVFFPEHRQFFLENANIFNASVTEWIRPFFSRRIGLDSFGNPIPLDGGVRLTSRSSRQQLGVLAMRQQALGASPASTFAVARYSRNIAGQSRLGGMLTYRRDDPLEALGQTMPGNKNSTYTIDGLWRPTQQFGLQGMLSGTDDDQTGAGLGGQLWAFYQNNHVYLSSLQYYSKDYNPGIGLELLDTNYVMHNLTASFDVRSKRLPAAIRSINPGASIFVFRSSDDGDLLFGFAPIRPIRLRFQGGAQIDFTVEPNWQRLDTSFFPAGLEIAPGKYNYVRYKMRARSNQSSQLAATAGIDFGSYFNGQLSSYSISTRFVPLPQIELSAEIQLDRLRNLGLAIEDKDTWLYRVNARFASSPRLEFNGFFQWDSLADRSAWNFRMSWEYRPLSYLYLVYNKNQTDAGDPNGQLSQEQIILKWTFLFDT
jgi:hypothetical protein